MIMAIFNHNVFHKEGCHFVRLRSRVVLITILIYLNHCFIWNLTYISTPTRPTMELSFAKRFCFILKLLYKLE